MGKKRLDFRTENESAFGVSVEQGAYAQPIPGDEQLPFAGIPQSERKLPVHPFETGRTKFLVEVHNDLGVGMG